MPISAEPLVRAALDTLRRQVESQMQLRRTLIELGNALAARDRAGLSALLPFCSTCQFTMTIPADPAAIPVMTEAVGEVMAEKHWVEGDILAVQLALQEAVANAIRHGCRGDVSKHVECSVRCDESGELVLVVRDPGSGFDSQRIEDPLDPANILKPSGRGIFLMNELMDDVQFADSGREVQMRKRKTSDLAPPRREDHSFDGGRDVTHCG